MPELVRDRGLVLRTQDHAETDRLVTLLSEGRGRVEILAKGARRLERPSGATLDLLNLAEVVYYRRRSGLHLLREASLLHGFPKLREELGKLEAGLALAKWAATLVPREVPDPRLFRLSVRFLLALEAGGNPEVLVRAYFLRTLALQGYRPHTRGCLACGSTAGLRWSPERGGLLCPRCGGAGQEIPARIWRTMDALLRLPLPALARLHIPSADLATLEELLLSFRTFQLAR